MWLTNNSSKTWEDYNCGQDHLVTIKPHSTFEVKEEEGIILLRNLGHENWLTKSEDPRTKEEIETTEIKIEI